MRVAGLITGHCQLLCFCYSHLNLKKKSDTQYPHFIDEKTEAGRGPLAQGHTAEEPGFELKSPGLLISTQHRPGLIGSLAPSLLWDPEQVTSL